MKQIVSFNVKAGPTEQGRKASIGFQIEDAINPFLGEHPEAKIESISMDLTKTFQTAVVILSYEKAEEAEAKPAKSSAKNSK